MIKVKPRIPSSFTSAWNKIGSIGRRDSTEPGEAIVANDNPREETPFFTPDILWVALVTVLWYFPTYLRFPGVPGNNETYWLGWFEWHDQGKYLECAKALSNFSLPAKAYVYPLGYPLLGALFVKFLPKHPFLVPNLLFTIGIVIAFYAACKTQLSKWESFGLCLFLILASAFTSNKILVGGLIWENSLLVPWNLIPVFFAAYLSTYLLIFRVATTRRLLLSSLAIGFASFCRPPDALFLSIIYLASLLDLKTVRNKIRAVVILAVPLTFFLGITLGTKLIVFGQWLSPYDRISAHVGFSVSDLPYKLYLVMLDGSPIHQYTDLMLVPQMPWLLLIVPGVIVISRATRNKAYFLVFSIITCFVIYVSFNAMAPTNVFNYHGYRYYMWTFPWLGLFAYVSLTRAVQKLGARTMIWTTVPVFAIVLIIGWQEVPVTVYSVNSVSPQAGGSHVEQRYSPLERRFVVNIKLPEPSDVDGIRFLFSKHPSSDLSTSTNWGTVAVEADGGPLNVYSNYNIFQIGHNVTIAGRNPIGKNGRITSLQVAFNKTDEPKLGRVTLLYKRFQLFGFARRMMVKLGLAPLAWQISTGNLYSYGEVISFGRDGYSQSYELSGWSDQEQDYTWTDGNRAALGFLVTSTNKDVLLNMELAGLTAPPRLNYQPVRVFANGALVAEWEVAERKRFTVRIPGSLLRNENILKIELEIPMASQPYELGMNSDKRKLGVACYNLSLAATD